MGTLRRQLRLWWDEPFVAVFKLMMALVALRLLVYFVGMLWTSVKGFPY
jgi:hypothetical protein